MIIPTPSTAVDGALSRKARCSPRDLSRTRDTAADFCVSNYHRQRGRLITQRAD